MDGQLIVWTSPPRPDSSVAPGGILIDVTIKIGDRTLAGTVSMVPDRNKPGAFVFPGGNASDCISRDLDAELRGLASGYEAAVRIIRDEALRESAAV